MGFGFFFRAGNLVAAMGFGSSGGGGGEFNLASSLIVLTKITVMITA